MYTGEDTTGSLTAPETVLALPRNSSSKLNEIVTRHRNYVLAKANGSLGTSVATITALSQEAQQKLNSLEERRLLVDDCCALCLDSMRSGEQAVTLPCGHRFHAGHQQSQAPKPSNSRKRAHEACKGIIYWLESNSTCPQCRFELPTEIEKPSESEAILVPLLHRQNRLISRQTDIIKEQREKIAELEKQLKKKSPKIPTPKKMNLSYAEEAALEINHERPNLTWQNTASSEQQEMRRVMLEHITSVSLTDIIVRGEMDEDSKNQKLQELAAKIEFILYCCSPSYACYADVTTIRQRTLRTVKSLADKARAMKLDRMQEETGEVGSMVNNL